MNHQFVESDHDVWPVVLRTPPRWLAPPCAGVRGAGEVTRLLAEAGDDRISAGLGRDHIYGDAGFNIDLSRRLSLTGSDTLQVVNRPAASDDVRTS